MKAFVRLLVGVTGGGALVLMALPFLLISAVTGQLQQASQAAAAWDIPPEVLPALQEAGQQAGIPWFLLAGVASVATDFAQNAPDGIARGDAPNSAIFPTVTPPIVTSGGGAGMFLVALAQAAPTLADPQDVRDSALWLALRLSTLAQGNPLAAGDLSQPAVSQFWQGLIAAAPVVIASIAPDTSDTAGSGSTPADPGDNPIQQFAGAVMTKIEAPVTAANLGAFSAWAAGEGSCAHFNPLDTTQPEPGATAFNTLDDGGHVWNYPSMATGVQATVTALTNGLYQPVIDAFMASAGVATVAAAVEHSPWGTTSFGSPDYAGKPCADDGGADTPTPTLPTVTGPGAVAATIVARAAEYQADWAEMTATATATP